MGAIRTHYGCYSAEILYVIAPIVGDLYIFTKETPTNFL